MLGLIGGSSSGLGAFGAFHNVCHYTCQGIVAILAVFGVSAAAMPLAFLLDARLVVLFSTIGLASLALSIHLHVRSRTAHGGDADALPHRPARLRDRRLLVLAALSGLSVVSLASGVSGIIGGGGTSASEGSAPSSAARAVTLDPETKTDGQGSVRLGLRYRTSSPEGLVFGVVMDTDDMDAPPLERYDLAAAASLSSGDDRTVRALRWSIEETGHMGHHVKGTLVFPAAAGDGPVIAGQSVDLVLLDVGGASLRRFSWKVVAR